MCVSVKRKIIICLCLCVRIEWIFRLTENTQRERGRERVGGGEAFTNNCFVLTTWLGWSWDYDSSTPRRATRKLKVFTFRPSGKCQNVGLVRVNVDSRYYIFQLVFESEWLVSSWLVHFTANEIYLLFGFDFDFGPRRLCALTLWDFHAFNFFLSLFLLLFTAASIIVPKFNCLPCITLWGIISVGLSLFIYTFPGC